MSTHLDSLEQKLSALRPAHLPPAARRRISLGMERRSTEHESISWLFAHHTGFQVALAGALSLALIVGLQWLQRVARPSSPVQQTRLAASAAPLPSLAYWENELAAAYPMSMNTVAVLRSPSMLTNLQIRR